MRRALLVGLLLLVNILGAAPGRTQTAVAWGDIYALLGAASSSGSVGKFEVDLRNRAMKVSDIELRTDTSPPVTLKIRELAATGIDLPAEGRLAAETVEALDVEFNLQAPLSLVYKAPRIVITGFDGALRVPRAVDPTAALDVTRIVLEHVVASSAKTIEIPALAATGQLLMAAPLPASASSFTYTDIQLRDIRNGLVAEMSLARGQFVIDNPAGPSGPVVGDVGRATTTDLDIAAFLAVLDPARTAEDRPLRLFARSTVGPYAVRSEKGEGVEIAAVELRDVTVRPAKLRIAELTALLERLGPRFDQPAAAAAIMERVADLYESIGIGLFEIRGIALAMPAPAIRLGSVRMKGFENGKLAEFVAEGLESQTPKQEPIRLARAALKGLDLANLIRLATKFGPGKAQPEELVQLMPLLEGVEIAGLLAPHDSGGVILIDAFGLSWGQFIGPIPTAVRANGRMSIPFGKAGPSREPDITNLFGSSSLSRATLAFDLNAALTRSTGVLALAPIRFTADNLFSLDARASVEDVPSELFTIDEDQAQRAAEQAKVASAELDLRDAGALDLALTRFAAENGLSMEAARAKWTEALDQIAAPLLARDPQLQSAVAAIAHFIAAPHLSLHVKLTPKDQLSLKALADALEADPTVALSRFRVEATTAPAEAR